MLIDVNKTTSSSPPPPATTNDDKIIEEIRKNSKKDLIIVDDSNEDDEDEDRRSTTSSLSLSFAEDEARAEEEEDEEEDEKEEEDSGFPSSEDDRIRNRKKCKKIKSSTSSSSSSSSNKNSANNSKNNCLNSNLINNNDNANAYHHRNHTYHYQSHRKTLSSSSASSVSSSTSSTSSNSSFDPIDRDDHHHNHNHQNRTSSFKLQSTTAAAESNKTICVEKFEVKQKPQTFIANKNDAIRKPFSSSSSTSSSSSRARSSLFTAEKDAAVVEPSGPMQISIYFCYGVLILFGYIRIFLERIGVLEDGMTREGHHGDDRSNYTPLYHSWQPFFAEYIYRRVSDIFAQPISGNPGGVVRTIERQSTDRNRSFRVTGRTFDCINLGSYDYLGFSRETQTEKIARTIEKYGVGVGTASELGGRTALHREMEQMFAQFIGKPDCAIFGMGFATNSANILALVDGGGEAKDTLIIGDQHSHMSVRAGMYLSRASFQFFKHNDFDDLERKIRAAITGGDLKRAGAPYRKIIILVEGVYSMEGTIVNLPRLVELKQRYRCYLYIDEAHSIGAIGPRGRGVCDYFGVDPAQVDILMGTMTKSFAAAGGYIAADQAIIEHIRANTANIYAGSMAAPVAAQIINTLRVLADERLASERFRRLLGNTHHMRRRLREAGFIIAGNRDSPVIPIMVYFPSKVGSMVRMGVRNGLALVAAGYPATSLSTCRIRLCMSASHSRETLDRAIAVLDSLGDIHQIKYAKQ